MTGAAFTSYSQENGANGTPVTATYSNGMQAYWTYLSDGSHDVLYSNVTGQPYTAYEMHYGSNGRPTTAFYNNGMMATWTYNADGSYAVEYDGVTGASYTSDTINYGLDGRPESATYNNGMTSTWTYADDGARLVAYQGMSGSAGYTSHASVIDTSGQTVADAEDMNNGSGILRTYRKQPHDLLVREWSQRDDVRRETLLASTLTPTRRSPSVRRTRRPSISRPASAPHRSPVFRSGAREATSFSSISRCSTASVRPTRRRRIWPICWGAARRCSPATT